MNVRRSNDGGWVRGAALGAALGATVLVLAAFYLGAAGVGLPQSGGSDAANAAGSPAAPRPPSVPALDGLLRTRLAALRTASLDPSDQGILIETLGGETLMSHNASRPINPASVLKLAPTLMALERFGPQHRFRTALLADGVVKDGVLEGSLGLRSDGDPTFGRPESAELGRALNAAGIREVSGDLLVAGPFSFQTTDETPQAVQRYKESLGRAGVRVRGVVRSADAVEGREVAAVESAPLIEIVQRQNAHSVNRTADNLGTTVGGPAAVARYLVETVGVDRSEVLVTHTSGLGHNAVSARGVMLVLRALHAECERRGITLDQIIPLNGVDSGTMRVRLVKDGLAGAVVAKTGTHYSEDGGVASICGVAYTREKGPVLFVILNSRGPVSDYRKWQDGLLADAVGAIGGSQPHARVTDIEAPEGESATQAAARDPFATKRSDRRSRAD